MAICIDMRRFFSPDRRIMRTALAEKNGRAKVILSACRIAMFALLIPAAASAEMTWEPEEPQDIPNPLFDDAEIRANLYYFQRDRKRLNIDTGKYEKNLHHSTIQSNIEISSGYAADTVGFDFAAFVTKDIENSGSPGHEISFFPWRDPWHADWSKADAKNGSSIYRAHLKLKHAAHWAKLGYFQPSGPGVIGTNWSLMPGTYLGAEAGTAIGDLTAAAAYATQYKAPWFRDMYHLRQSDGTTPVDYLWSLGARYAASPELSVELAYGESQNYLKNSHLKIKFLRELAPEKTLYLTYQLYAMDDSAGGATPNNNFAATARQHYLALNYSPAPWTFQTEFLKTYAPSNRAENVGYFAYRLIGAYGGGNGAYEPWWNNRSDWDHNEESAAFVRITRRLDDLIRLPGWTVGASAARGWGGKVYGVEETLREHAYSLELGYVVPYGRLKNTSIRLHYTHYNNKTEQPSWSGFKNAFQDERDLKLIVSIPIWP